MSLGGCWSPVRWLDGPECGKKFKERFGWLQQKKDLACPKCGILFNTDKVARDLRDAEKRIRNRFR